MSERINNRWTPELLDRCRGLYEAGTNNQALGAMFGIKASTIAVMAWQRDWRRERRLSSGPPNRASANGQPARVATDFNPPIPPTRMEAAFNTRLCRMIRAYWRSQGRDVDLTVETMGNGIQCIRSRSINGIPST